MTKNELHSCIECGAKGSIRPSTVADDFIACPACGNVAVWTGSTMRDLKDAERITFLSLYPLSPSN
jgi:predicted RNA-binding Zn-ribbon protein involved in translation (DUF1610 family)